MNFCVSAVRICSFLQYLLFSNYRLRLCTVQTFVFKNYIQRTNFKTLQYCTSSISHRIDQYRLYITQDPLKFNSPNLQIQTVDCDYWKTSNSSLSDAQIYLCQKRITEKLFYINFKVEHTINYFKDGHCCETII